MPGDNWLGSEFFAALAGALVAGGISFALQWQSFAAERRFRRLEHKRVSGERVTSNREAEAVLAFSIGLKMNRALTAIQQFKEHLDKAFLESVRVKMSLSSATRPLSSDFGRLTFTLEELSLVRKFRQANLLNRMINMPAILDMYIGNMALFRAGKVQINDLAHSIDIKVTGTAAMVYKDQNAYKARMKMAELNDLAAYLLGNATVDYVMFHSAFFDFQQAAIDRLGRDGLEFIWEISEQPVFRKQKPA